MNRHAIAALPLWQRVARRMSYGDGCWEYLGALNGGGYGVVGVSKPRSKQFRAHRVMYEHFVGPIPEGFDLDHLCRNRKCVRPDHLEAVTRKENLRRSPLVGKWRKHPERIEK